MTSKKASTASKPTSRAVTAVAKTPTARGAKIKLTEKNMPKGPAPVEAAKASDAAPGPSRLVATARVLKRETEGAYDVAAIADDDKGYGARLRVLKALCGTDRVVVKDAEPARLARELRRVFGARNAGDLALKCAAAIKDADKADRAAAKADAERSEKARKAAAHAAPVFDGRPILPAAPRLNKKQRAAKEAADKARLTREIREAESSEAAMGFAKPKPDAKVAVDMDAVKLLEDPANGIVIMRLEFPNSQGAVCVYNNGRRVAAGVVPTEILNSLRPIASTDMVRDVNQLLHPITAGVEVTPTAERHLTAVLEHCKEIVDMATKKAAKAAETAAKTKKFEAPKGAATKATAAKKPAKGGDAPTERKSSLFRLLNDTKSTWSGFATQKGEIVAAFVKLGAVGKAAAGVTRGALIAALPDVPDKNISFYLSKWQPAGIVEKLAAAE